MFCYSKQSEDNNYSSTSFDMAYFSIVVDCLSPITTICVLNEDGYYMNVKLKFEL
jgi:hypothetical protein